MNYKLIIEIAFRLSACGMAISPLIGVIGKMLSRQPAAYTELAIEIFKTSAYLFAATGTIHLFYNTIIKP